MRIALVFVGPTPSLTYPLGERVNLKLGNNPIVFAVPCDEGHIVLDMAISQYSYGQLNTYKLLESLLPFEGGYDADGNLTTNPSAIMQSGRPLAIGYWKGSGLSLLLDLIEKLASFQPRRK